MFRVPVTVVVFLGCVLSAAMCPAAEREMKSWQAAQVKKLQGRWSAAREEKTDQGKVQRRWIDLEFADGGKKLQGRWSAIRRLKAAGWSVDEICFGSLWLVSGANGENIIRAEAATQTKAWQQAIRQAEACGMLRLATTGEENRRW